MYVSKAPGWTEVVELRRMLDLFPRFKASTLTSCDLFQGKIRNQCSCPPAACILLWPQRSDACSCFWHSSGTGAVGQSWKIAGSGVGIELCVGTGVISWGRRRGSSCRFGKRSAASTGRFQVCICSWEPQQILHPQELPGDCTACVQHRRCFWTVPSLVGAERSASSSLPTVA